MVEYLNNEVCDICRDWGEIIYTECEKCDIYRRAIMKPERKIINDELNKFTDKLDKLHTEVEMCKKMIEDLADLKAISYEKTKTSSKPGSAIEKIIMCREDYYIRVGKAVSQIESCEKGFEEYISPLNPHLRNILRERYKKGKHLRYIADRFNYSVEGISKNIAKAQDILYKNYYKK